MITIERNEFKTDPVFKALYQTILAKYRVTTHTEQVLFDNKHIKNFCEESRHYAELAGDPILYLHFDVSSWYSPKGILTRVEQIGIYDDFQEYQSSRLKGLHSTVNQNGICLN